MAAIPHSFKPADRQWLFEKN